VSLSTTNLLAFCASQAAHRMARLRSDDLLSGKKYLPAVYVERENADKRLLALAVTKVKATDGRAAICNRAGVQSRQLLSSGNNPLLPEKGVHQGMADVDLLGRQGQCHAIDRFRLFCGDVAAKTV
jgi:hypothetical protein